MKAEDVQDSSGKIRNIDVEQYIVDLITVSCLFLISSSRSKSELILSPSPSP